MTLAYMFDRLAGRGLKLQTDVFSTSKAAPFLVVPETQRQNCYRYDQPYVMSRQMWPMPRPPFSD